jgi:hypothetical protein
MSDIRGTVEWTPREARDRAEIERLQARVRELEDALRECANDLANMIHHAYPSRDVYQVIQSKYDRDMEPVIRARGLLAALREGGNG